MTELRLHGLSYGDRLRAVDLTVCPGETVGLIGPNASGKTTLLRCVYGTLAPTAGRALLDGDDLHALGPKARARRIATVPQDSAVEFELTVGELVALGRSPHKRFWEGDTGADRERAEAALARVGLADLADRPYPTLSGGERQRALVARALVQDPALLVLDEPTNHLDIRHQLDVLALVRTLGTTNLLALHDLNLAGAYCDRLYVLERGRLVTGGTPAEVLTPALLATVYGVDAEVIPHPRTGSPTVLYQHRPALGREPSTM
ncbi:MULTISPECIES: ABC transporter ATP-binding protein [Streptomyces]|uniref:ABC transporter (Iron.B12.siderophore.hemin), ATP-binding component n=1 Tax=Streptomyces venezuelae (strain ATCC 10712 / CBS 650.69 / DSM 40230 / JCM 4526 / NBRC 13096 / PD 04745) TaxID=953739 RepID=F2R4S9_STRVP|nr:ABC transporter ATP-binding protein [Streptomyces venezuelae]APE21854.1 histidinol phosphatase [Streptomyces venezuelae]QER99248.1 ABC transporter ATP-binding protein [Streptomyces venezuelae ATCC 10712]CCA55950.1 ABC transporter (iron.B12.siderophore.hemin), ATP-binding component [Streptomyces venezuelae ATCC 10712]